MQSINFNTGYKTYAINGDESNVIRVNLADPNLFKRMEEVLEYMDTFKDEITDDMAVSEVYEKFDNLVKNKIDYAFGEGTSKAVFGNVNCLTVANDEGECIFETFLNAIMPIIYNDVNEAAKNQNRHISDMVDKGKLDKYVQQIKETVQ
ncbi:MAG: hypothetical protein K2M82_07175 [Lachnospiraceae bacterium]|nr:hypothetical protein [Lachnospiraceae bacterium]